MSTPRPARRRTPAVVLALLVGAVGAACGSGNAASSGGPLTVVVSAPLTSQPWVGRFVERGARLAIDQVNADGGVDTGAGKRPLALQVRDDQASPQQAVANARTAVDAGAVALITDGVGAAAVAEVTDPAKLPVFVVFDGGESVIDPAARPTLFRLAPANKPMATRLGDYISSSRPKVALLADDTQYGREGADSLRAGLARNRIPIVADPTLPAGAADVTPQVVAARQSGADHLVVWARAPLVAAVIRAARSIGWQAPVYTGPTGEDPLVRQQLADHPEWLDGVTFVSFRITSELGPEPFAAYRSAYEKQFGAEPVGVSQHGRPVMMPPDWSMYSFDAVKLLAAALQRSKGKPGAPLLQALQTVVITGANGDERGFSATDREGVSPDDMYFARFDGFVFRPVTDDLLSQNLPPVPQLG